MKNKLVKVLLSVTLAASMAAGAPMAALAEDAAETTTEAAEAAGTDAEEETGEDFEIALSDGTVTVKNETSRSIASAELKEAGDADTEDAGETDADADAEDAGETDADAEDAGDADAAEDGTDALALVLTEEDGTEHIFEEAQPETWTDPVLTESYGFLYITYTDGSGASQEAAETADEVEFEEPVTMYVSTNVNIREAAGTDSESLKVASLGEEYTVTGAAPGWYKVENGEISGYAFHSYLTEDKEAVDALVKAKEEAEAAAAAAAAQAAAEQQAAAAAAAQAAADAAAAQAAADAAAAQAAAEAEAAQAVTEVSRQAYDDCDGSGHGYYEITWSDGSVTYEEY